jgi:hypothetical protein
MATAPLQSAEEIYAIIREAIQQRHVVAVNYRGSIREMCPHVLGTTKGSPHALMYQFAGESKGGLQRDGSPENWRCLRLDELSHVVARKSKGEWHTASNYSAMQNCVDEIDIKIETRTA